MRVRTQVVSEFMLPGHDTVGASRLHYAPIMLQFSYLVLGF